MAREFANMVAAGGYGNLIELPANCQASFAYTRNADNQVLPLKFMQELDSKAWCFGASRYDGVFVCFVKSLNKYLIIHRSEIAVNSTTTSGILKKRKEFMCDKTQVCQVLHDAYDRYELMSHEDIIQQTKVDVFDRQVYIDRQCNALEAEAHKEITNILDAGTYKRTPEKCLADAGYSHGDWDNCIAIQIKSRSFTPNKPTCFNKVNIYNGLLLLCRIMNKDEPVTLVIPGSLVEQKSLHLTIKENTTYYPYLVSDEQLNNVIRKIFEAISSFQRSIIYPSGKKVDISSLKLYRHVDLCVPQGENNKKEALNRILRETVLPDIQYEDPEIEGTTVDILMNGVRVQDKHGYQKDLQAIIVKLRKNGGYNKNHKRGQVPYNVGDFELLFAFHKNTHFFVIPAYELNDRGYLKNEKTSGKLSVMCYIPGFQKNGKPANTWTEKYCLDVKDPDLHDKVVKILESTKTSSPPSPL